MSYAILENITAGYDGKHNILSDLNLSLERGELVSLLGASGCGKTTTLRVMAGFVEPRAGHFMVNGKDLTRCPVYKRNFGLVFQSYALFPHLTVFENISFGLKLRKKGKAEIKKQVDEILEITGLSNFAGRYPKQLSGGQRQRTALARALVIEPELLLLDEPLSNLDAKLRLGMRTEIKTLQKKMGVTTLFVTHDQEECFSISDRVAIMHEGYIEQFDTPEQIYSHPVNEFVARFVGFANFFAMEKIGTGKYKIQGNHEIQVDPSPGEMKKEGPRVIAAIRPGDIILSTVKNREENIVPCTVDAWTFLGSNYQYRLEIPEGELTASVPREQVFRNGDKVFAFLPPSKIVLC
jgi:putative spermidine/putrescine transport system ATP-binding protein